MTGYQSKKDMAQDKLDSMEREALKLALEALRMADELCRGHGVDFKEYGLKFDRDIQVKYKEAITAIKEVLAQPAQEPDTYRSVPHGHCTHPKCKEVFSAYIEANKRLAHYEPEGKSPMILNAAPPQRPWVEPTEGKWFEWWRVSPIADATQAEFDFADFLIIAQAVTAKLKEHNNG